MESKKWKYVVETPKKHSVRFKAESDQAPIQTIYVTKDGLAAMGTDGKKPLILTLEEA